MDDNCHAPHEPGNSLRGIVCRGDSTVEQLSTFEADCPFDLHSNSIPATCSKEIKNIVREIVIQILYLLYLVLKLHSAPILCALRKLRLSRGPMSCINLNIINLCVCRSEQSGVPQAVSARSLSVTAFARARVYLVSFCRMLKGLYWLCKVLGEDPEYLSPRKLGRVGERGTNTSLDSVQSSRKASLVREARVQDATDFLPSPIDSELYDAPLTFSSPLRGTLAMREFSSSRGLPRDILQISDFPITGRPCYPLVHGSIQTNPDIFNTPSKMPSVSLEHQRLSLNSDLASPETASTAKIGGLVNYQTDQPDTQVRELRATRTKNRDSNSSHEAKKTTWTRVFSVCDHHEVSLDLQKCPRCTKRQSASRLPRRTHTSADFTIKSPNAESQPSSNNPRKLQRKMRRH